MPRRLFSILVGLLVPAVALAADEIRRKPSGVPDLTGNYDIASLTPFERDPRYGDRLELTAEEAEKIASTEAAAMAIANAESQDDAVDVDQLYVKSIFVDGGPSLKRIRPQPMGRAFRILKRTSHVTIKLDTKKGGDEA